MCPKILIVDDLEENLLVLENILATFKNAEFYKANSGNEALKLMLQEDFCLVILDVQMPEMNGFEVAKLMRGMEKTKHIPIIFVTALSREEKNIFEGYKSGAVDYLLKPIVPDILRSKVDVFLDLYAQKQEVIALTQALKKENLDLIKKNSVMAMAVTATHEISQPLTVILGSLDMFSIKYSNKIDEDMNESIQKMRESVMRIKEILDTYRNTEDFKFKDYIKGIRMVDFSNNDE